MQSQYNFAALQRSLADVVQEAQIKLGYNGNPISLYYPAESVNHLLGTDLPPVELEQALANFGGFTADTLGEVSTTRDDQRFCFHIPAEGTKYVHETRPDNSFLADFIHLTAKHGVGLEDILAVFRRYSEHVSCTPIEHDEFDYLIYFEDGKPDNYRYCIQLDGLHVVYHRFTPENYAAFDIQEATE